MTRSCEPSSSNGEATARLTGDAFRVNRWALHIAVPATKMSTDGPTSALSDRRGEVACGEAMAGLRRRVHWRAGAGGEKGGGFAEFVGPLWSNTNCEPDQSYLGTQVGLERGCLSIHSALAKRCGSLRISVLVGGPDPVAPTVPATSIRT